MTIYLLPQPFVAQVNAPLATRFWGAQIAWLHSSSNKLWLGIIGGPARRFATERAVVPHPRTSSSARLP